MEIASIQRVLTNLQATEEEAHSALKTLSQMLSRDPSPRLRLELFRVGVIKAVLGLLRCSSNASTLTDAAHVVALTSFGCSKARRMLASMGVVELLIQLLSPSFRRGLGSHVDTGSKAWLSVCEQAVVALRKLTYMSEDIHALLARHSGVGAVINLCNDRRLTELWATFPQESAAKLTQLIEGRDLVARAARVVAEEKEQLLMEFPVLGELGGGIRESYPVFILDLADCNKQWLADILVDEGLAWPGSITFPAPYSPQWAVVRGTHVQDPRYVWCNFSPNKCPQHVVDMWTCLHKLTPPSSSTFDVPLKADNVYAVYCERVGWWAGSQWCRAWLLRELHGKENTFFAMDFGFTVTVPHTHIRPLPPECRGIPPQAVPCQLMGVKPPCSTVLLENVAAILRNIAFEHDAYRMEVKSCGGIETLLELSCCPVLAVRVQVLGALLNLAHCPAVCQQMRELSAVKMMIGVFEEHEGEEEGELALGCLQNLLMGDKGCVDEFMRCGGPEQLLEGRQLDSNMANILKTVEQLNEGRQQPLSSAAEVRQESSPCITRPLQRSPSTKSRKKCIYRLLAEEPDPATLSHPPPPSPPPSIGVEVDCLTVGQQLAAPDQDLIVAYLDVSGVDQLHCRQLLRPICGLANTNRCCALYIGVMKDGTVRGLPLSRGNRDWLRVEIDHVANSLHPTLKLHSYKVSFIPVLTPGRRTSCCTEQHLWVACVKLFPMLPRQIYVQRRGGEEEVCYYHMANSTVVLSMSDVREMVAVEEAQKQQKEVEQLRQTVETLKMALPP